MRVVSFDVSRALAWHIQGHVAVEDQEQFWRICYYFDKLHDVNRAFRATKLILPLIIIIEILLWGSPDWRFLASSIYIILLYSTYIHRRECHARFLHAIKTDEAKWLTLAGEGREIEQLWTEGDPTQEITITLPDD